MKLFLIRHADAIEYKTETVDNDEYRFITPKGRITTRKVAKALRDKLKKVDRIFTSPLIRAVQTAEIVASGINFKNDIEVVNEMKNESTIASLIKLLENNNNLKSVALVGHEPKMGILVKSFSGKSDLYDFTKSSVCLIDFNPSKGEGKFVWYFDAKQMEFIK